MNEKSLIVLILLALFIAGCSATTRTESDSESLPDPLPDSLNLPENPTLIAGDR